MFEPFTELASKAIRSAHQETRRLNHKRLGAEQLLIGLIDAGGIATKCLTLKGITLNRAREQVEKIIGPGTVAGPDVESSVTPRYKRVLSLSRLEAQRLRHGSVTTGHLLLGLLCEGDGVGIQ